MRTSSDCLTTRYTKAWKHPLCNAADVAASCYTQLPNVYIFGCGTFSSFKLNNCKVRSPRLRLAGLLTVGVGVFYGVVVMILTPVQQV